MLRLEILYKYGGIYADIDSVALRSFGELQTVDSTKHSLASDCLPAQARCSPAASWRTGAVTGLLAAPSARTCSCSAPPPPD